MGLVLKQIPNSVKKSHGERVFPGRNSQGGDVTTNRLDEGVCSHLVCSQAEMLFLSEFFSDFYTGKELAILNTMSIRTLSLNSSIQNSPNKDTGKLSFSPPPKIGNRGLMNSVASV